MGDHMLQMGEAQKYLQAQYGVKWSRPFITKLIREGKLRGVQPGGDRGWWYIARESIDALLKSS